MAKLTDASGRPHTGIMPYLVIGIVIDYCDPEKQGRVRVKFPTLHGTPESHWLRVLTPSSGNEFGMYTLPEINTEVLVGFLQGSHDVGIVLGQLWNGMDNPPPEADATRAYQDSWSGQLSTAQPTAGSSSYEKNDRRIFRSRSGHIFVFDDSEGAESVQIWDKTREIGLALDSSAQTVFLQSSGDLHVRASKDLYLEAGANIYYEAAKEIKGRSGLGTTHQAGAALDVKAQSDVKVEAGASMELKAGTTLDAKAIKTTIAGTAELKLSGGAKAELSGGAMTKVVGGVVMIN